MIEKNIYFIFFIDVSGSMLGKNIAAVNAVIKECINDLQQTHGEISSNIKVGIYSFSEKVYEVVKLQPILSIDSPSIRIIPDHEGFYALSSYTCLYNGMKRLFQRLRFDIGKDSAFIFIATDGKSTDNNNTIDQEIKQFPIYQSAHKYLALTESEENVGADVLAFIEGISSNIVPLDQLPDVVAKIQGLLGNS